MKDNINKTKTIFLFLASLWILVSAIGCNFTPPNTATTTMVLDTQEFNRREELAILKAKPTHTICIDTLYDMANSILQTRTDTRSVGNGEPVVITEIIKLPTMTEKCFTSSFRNERTIDTVEEEPVELYYFTTENLEKENCGFILTSNDDRIGYVLAIVDDGNLTDTENPFVEVFTTKLAEYIEETIFEYASITEKETEAAIEKWHRIEQKARTLTAHWDIVGDDYVATGKVETDFKKLVDKLIKTQWGQRGPYNVYVKYHQDRNNPLGVKDYIAGCGPVAAAQLVAYYGYISNANKPGNFTIGSGSSVAKWNGTYNFDNLTAQPKISATGSGTTNEELRGQVAALMHQIGITSKASYNDGSTSTVRSNVANAFINNFDYKSDYGVFIEATVLSETNSSSTITYKNNSKNWVISQLSAKPKAHPILIRGTGLKGGHMWLIDGYGTMTYYIEYLNGKSSTFLYTSTLTLTNCIMVHCNLGWNGTNDGWYIYGIFDTNHMAALDGHTGIDIRDGDFSSDVYILAPYR